MTDIDFDKLEAKYSLISELIAKSLGIVIGSVFNDENTPDPSDYKGCYFKFVLEDGYPPVDLLGDNYTYRLYHVGDRVYRLLGINTANVWATESTFGGSNWMLV